MRFGRRSTMVAALVALALATAACGDGADDPEATGTTGEETTGATGEQGASTVTAVEYEFQLDGAVSAGPTTLELRNEGEEEHELVLMELGEGRTIDDVTSLIEDQGADGPPPDWATIVGGTFAPPGETSEQPLGAELNADGTYVIACFVTTADGVPHAELGMVQGLEVA